MMGAGEATRERKVEVEEEVGEEGKEGERRGRRKGRRGLGSKGGDEMNAPWYMN